MRRETYKNEKKTRSMEVDDEPQPPVSSGDEDEEYDPEGEGDSSNECDNEEEEDAAAETTAHGEQAPDRTKKNQGQRSSYAANRDLYRHFKEIGRRTGNMYVICLHCERDFQQIMDKHKTHQLWYAPKQPKQHRKRPDNCKKHLSKCQACAHFMKNNGNGRTLTREATPRNNSATTTNNLDHSRVSRLLWERSSTIRRWRVNIRSRDHSSLDVSIRSLVNVCYCGVPNASPI